MLVKKLIQTRNADADLPPEVRAGLVESLFGPITSLIAGALGCAVIGAGVALRAADGRILIVSAALLATGLLRVVSALLYKSKRATGDISATRLWERIYEFGAWVFAALLGLQCWMTLTHTTDASMHLAVSTTAAGYAAAISGRNAGRPFIAIGQLTLTSLPLAISLMLYPEWLHKAQGFVVLLFIYGMMDITLGIRDVIVQALIMTRKEAALAARFEEQANRFDIALNNMSHGLCMLDDQDRLQVWNDRFIELLNLQRAPIRVGMRITDLMRHSVRAGNHHGRSVKSVFLDLAGRLACGSNVEITFGERVMALSRRIMNGGGSVVIIEDVTERKRAQDRIERLARFDELTGLANRTQFVEQIDAVLAAVRAADLRVAIQMIDLDRFKTINDELGHATGDAVLQLFASTATNTLGGDVLFGRIGGEEFAAMLPVGDLGEATAIADRVRRKFEAAAATYVNGDLRPTVSAGVTAGWDPAQPVSQLLAIADQALYRAKANGRNRVETHDSGEERAAAPVKAVGRRQWGRRAATA